LTNIETLVADKTTIERDYDDRSFKRGEIYYLDMEDINAITKHVSHKNRPAIIISNDTGNTYSSTVIVALLTSAPKKEYPFQYKFTINNRESTIMFEQILTVDKSRILEKYGEITPQQMREAEQRLMNSLALNRFSLENILDIDVMNMVTKKSKRSEETYFEIIITFQNNQTSLVNVTLDDLKQYNPTISRSTDLNELRRMLDCCKGLSFIVNHNNPSAL
jgi:mRNA interferase MazF